MRALLPNSIFSPGQHFVQPSGGSLLPDQAVTLIRIEHDRFGFRRLVFRGPSGREITAFAEQIEMAIAVGDLFPIPATERAVA